MSRQSQPTRAIALSTGADGPVIVTRADAELAPDLVAAARAEGIPVLAAPPLAEALCQGDPLPGPLVESLLAILLLAEKLAPPTHDV